MKVFDIRAEFGYLLKEQKFVIDKTGQKVLEIIGASFVADEESIFGAINYDYIERELEWYKSQSLYVKDIPGKTPAIWEQVSSKYGEINSNYGWAIWNELNYDQYENVFQELKRNPFSRRAQMIYTRPSMHYDYNRDGMSDFMCTTSVQYFIRDGKLISFVSMRSNDAWAGYRNDFAWQKYVAEQLAEQLKVEVGDIIWNVGSLHVYEKQFYLVDHYMCTGQTHIAKADYEGQYK